MKNILFVVLFCTGLLSAEGQERLVAVSSGQALISPDCNNATKEGVRKERPQVSFVTSFSKPGQVLDADSTLNISVNIKNENYIKSGKASCMKFWIKSSNKGLFEQIKMEGKTFSITDTLYVYQIGAHIVHVNLLISAPAEVSNDTIIYEFCGASFDGLVSQRIDIQVITRALRKPKLEFAGFNINGIHCDTLFVEEQDYKLTLKIKNSGAIDAIADYYVYTLESPFILPEQRNAVIKKGNLTVEQGRTLEIDIPLRIVNKNIEKEISISQLPIYIEVVPRYQWGKISAYQLPVFIKK